LLDISEESDYCDHLIIMTADNPRQIDTLSKKLKDMMWDRGLPVHHVEGEASSGWVLLDSGNFVTHIFSEENRSWYDLDGLWEKATTMVRIQ